MRHIRIIILLSAALFSALSLLEFFVLEQETIFALASEDGFFEVFGSLCLLASGIVMILLWRGSVTGNDLFFFSTRRNVLLLVTGALFLFGAMEEMSWGQRLFGYETPEFFRTHNEQQEVNVHNLTFFHGRDKANLPKRGVASLFNMDFLFSLFWFTLFVALPIVNRYHAPANALFRRVNLPIVGPWASLLAMALYIATRAIEPTLTHAGQNALVEIKECDLELLILTASIDVLLQQGSSVNVPAWVKA